MEGIFSASDARLGTVTTAAADVFTGVVTACTISRRQMLGVVKGNGADFGRKDDFLRGIVAGNNQGCNGSYQTDGDE